MLIKFYYHTKYDTIKLNIINKYITNYNSKIYNKQKILKEFSIRFLRQININD